MKTDQEQQNIVEIIRRHNTGPGSLIQVLNAIQEEHGYLPKEIQQLVAKELKVPFSKVFEVTSFYSRFTTEKMGKYELSLCLGTACYVRGAQDILDELKAQLGVTENQTTPDGLFTLRSCRCVGACALAPVLSVNKDVHSKVSAENVSDILKMYM